MHALVARRSCGCMRWRFGGNRPSSRAGNAPHERAALEWTEAVTLISHDHVPEGVYAAVREHLSEEDVAGLLMTILAINCWNRVAVSQRLQAGSYVSSLKPEAS
jgi:alkylhydroperoxidase family enzyme